MSEQNNNNEGKDTSEVAAAYAAIGAGAGAILSGLLGNAVITGVFGGIATGAAPFIAGGALVGLAAYGVKRALED